ncbi:MAG: branched-chain amino acid aminotransferase [Desulfobacterales bacterium]|nr:MAG: branched-chain amino acid aminotransferase [Desulfobacterales bacterium]
MDIPITLVRAGMARQKPADESQLGFGIYFSNHMFILDYEIKKGWHSPRIVPYAPFILDPAAVVLHYGQEVFDGHKAYRHPDNRIALFRAQDNLKRMQQSCERLCIPGFPTDLVYEGMKKLIQVDKDWVPAAPGTSLYVRPTIIANEAFLGVRPAHEYIFYIITGPVGAYYPEGFNPVTILVEETYVRAAPGGLGQAKTSANYAASLKAQVEAHAKGYTQVLWLDAVERRYVEEVGTMNICFKFKDELVTPPLAGTILPGITRDSILTMCRDMGLTVNERPVAIDEVIDKAKSGELAEAFGVGTAAVISPVASFGYKGEDVTVADGQTGELAQTLFKRLTDLQYGLAPDPYGWIAVIA